MLSNESSKTASSVRKGVTSWAKNAHGSNTTTTKWPIAKYKLHGLPTKWRERYNDIYDVSGKDEDGDPISYCVIGLYAGPDKDRFVINLPLFEWSAAEDVVIGVYEGEDDKSVTIYVASADDIDADWKAGKIEEAEFQTPVLLLPHKDTYWTKSDWVHKKNDLIRKIKEKKDRTHHRETASNGRETYWPDSWRTFWRSKGIPESVMSRNPTSDRTQGDIQKVADYLGAKDIWVTHRGSYGGEHLKVTLIY